MSDLSSVGFLARRSSGSSSAGLSVDSMVRTQRRMSLLQTYASDFVTSSPSGAIALAEGTRSDDEILQGATEAVGFSNVTSIRKDLGNESPEAQRTIYANLPANIQKALGTLGYQPPEEGGGGGRLFGSVPLLGPVAERALDWGSVPLVGGALEEGQHFVGEGLEPVGKGLNTALGVMAWPQQQVSHFYRASVFAREEGQTDPGGWQMLIGGWTPSEIGRAWAETSDDKGYIRPGYENRARGLLDHDNQAYDLAKAIALKKPLDAIIDESGFEPGSAEATQLIVKLQQLQGTEAFGRAVDTIASGQVSFGRIIAQEAFGLEDTEHGLGRTVSGLADAGFLIYADPILVGGKFSAEMRFGRNAFRLETGAGGFEKAARQSDAALMALRAREGADIGEIHSGLNRLTKADMRLGRNILAWSDRVAEGFRTGDFASMMRDLPNASTAMAHLSDFHVRQIKQGLLGLDTPLGVIEYLQNRDSLLALMGTRVGGASPKALGYLMPTFTPAERAMASTKAFWQKTIDWSRFVGETPERAYGPRLADMISAAGNPRAFARQSGRWMASRTVGSAGRTMALLTSHTPYRELLPLTGPDSVPEFSRLINTGLFGGMKRQTMDEFINAFAAGDVATRAHIEERFLEELFRRGGIQGTDFAKRFIGAHRTAYALDKEAGKMRLVDVGSADTLAIPDVRGFLSGAYKDTFTRQVFHNPLASTTEAALSRYWKPAVLLRVGFIARAAGEELLHTLLKNGARHYLGAVGAGWEANAAAAREIRAGLAVAEQAGKADDIIRLRHALADVEGSMVLSPVRSLLSASDRMVTAAFASTREDVAGWRRSLAAKAERTSPMNPGRTVSGLERMADEMSLWSSGFMSRIAHMGPGELTKERIGALMAEHWNPRAAAAAKDLLSNPVTQRYFAERISGSTMTPWELRGVTDASGRPIQQVTWSEMRQGRPILEEVNLRPRPGDVVLDRVLDDPNFYDSLFTRHGYTRTDRTSRAVVDNVLPRYVGSVAEPVLSGLGYEDLSTLRRHLNDAWAHTWSPTEAERLARLEPEAKAHAAFEGGEDALRFMRRYIDGEVDPNLPKGWIGGRLKDLFTDAGTDLSAGRLLGFLDDPKVPQAAKRWLLYDYVDPTRLIDDPEQLRRAMRHAARGRLARPDMQPALRASHLYAQGEQLARPVAEGIAKVYVPLMPASYNTIPLTDDFVEAARQRILHIGGYGPDQAETIARNVAAASVNPGIAEAAGRIGLVPLGAWGAADPRIAEAIMGAAEDVTGIKATFGILEVPDEVIERSTDRVLAQGVRRSEGAIDYSIDNFRLLQTQPTGQERRYVHLDIGGEAWDDGALDTAKTAFEATPPEGTVRMYSGDHANWSETVPDGPFWFADVPAGGESPQTMLSSFGVDRLRDQARILNIKGYSRMKKQALIDALLERPEMRATLERHGAGAVTDEIVDAAGAHRLPGLPGTYAIESREVSDGLGEITALEHAADRTVDEITDILTTLRKPEVDDDVLHEIVEPLKRGDRTRIDPETGDHVFEPGYDFNHLRIFTSPERLPTTSYGPKMVAGRELTWNKFVTEWFDGPVNRAISSMVRKPMFLSTYGDQLAAVGPVADLMVDPAVRQAAEEAVHPDKLDDIVRDITTQDARHVRFLPDDEIERILTDYGETVDGIDDLKRFATQRYHAMNLARENALNRTMNLMIPYLDDHRIRSAFQNYVGNFIPFLFAEEQFLKRWGRSVIESPEMIRKAQVGMNGLRSMGVVRKDEDGRDIFVYPMVGHVTELLSHALDWIIPGKVHLPYAIQMTGDVGYTLPGFGDQMGVPSVGPLVGLGIEELSRMHPELADIEGAVVGRGANRPLWQYVIPTGAARLWEAGWGDIDQGQLASATIQAVQTMAINGQLPPETATPEERQEFIDRARAQARFIIAARGVFGMTAPAAPAVHFEHDDLTEEFRALLQADLPFEDAITLFLSKHPEANPASMLAATVASTETEFSGLDMPTDKAYDWTNSHQDLVQAYPAAAAWLVPRAEGDERFSQRAYNQEVALGLRLRKSPKDFIDDLYFRTASQDYFDARQATEERTAGLSGASKQVAMREWSVWKDAYFAQHPLFAVMLQDPERQQKRHQAIDQLTALSARPDVVPDELAEMMHRFEDFRLNIAAMRGDRRQAVASRRASIVGETAAWMQWQVAHHPWLSGPYLRLIEPELRDADEDAVLQVVD